ncbi:hypothetical protein CP523_15480 [Clostridium septicum]|uniref:Uncharacterized protein n=1 Tax=Clostridium septicum TaxID=1504 RepID=A0A9N7JPJ5_CLOSE|nr:hypothetical protein CP523_15480 [Clostridium septicum]
MYKLYNNISVGLCSSLLFYILTYISNEIARLLIQNSGLLVILIMFILVLISLHIINIIVKLLR